MTKAQVGVIGGSGFYQMHGLSDMEEVHIDTPFGATSDDMVVGTLEGARVAFLSRHGMGHRILPMEVPYLANIWAMKSIGIERIIAINAVGSMLEEMAPGTSSSRTNSSTARVVLTPSSAMASSRTSPLRTLSASACARSFPPQL